ncbi:MAG: DUF2922 domain-containing protein [Peptococcaceae bacterium]
MTTSKTLYMRFGNDEGEKVTVALPDPVDNADAENVSTVMDVVLSKQVLLAKDGSKLTVALSAMIRTVEEQDLF